MECNSRLTVAALLVLVAAAPYAASAQSAIERYNREIRDASTIAALDGGLFGESVSPRDGSTTFRVVDVSVPTNSGLAVEVGRRLDVGAIFTNIQGRRSGAASEVSQFGKYWQLDVPYMVGTFDALRGWVGRLPIPDYLNAATQSRCTYLGDGPPPTKGVGYFGSVEYEPEEYFSGIEINIPGIGRESLLKGSPQTIGGKVYLHTTHSQWRVTCLASLKNGTGEGFEVLLPNGTSYRFDWKYRRGTAYLVDTDCVRGAPPVSVMPSMALVYGPWSNSPEFQHIQTCREIESLPRTDEFLYATKVTDRFGNEVTYDYEEVPSSTYFRLKRIYSSDGAEILLNYGADNRIQNVTANGRIWSYGYVDGALGAVTQPDASRWEFGYGPRAVEVSDYRPNDVWRACVINIGTRTTSVAAGTEDANSFTFKHPSGATGTFDFRRLLHGTRQSEGLCQTVGRTIERPSGTPYVPHSSVYQVVSLVRKVITGPGTTPSIWSYWYEPGWNAPYSATTTIANPIGVIEKLVHKSDCESDANCRNYYLASRTISEGSVIKRREDYEYVESGVGQNFPDAAGGRLEYGGRLFGGYAAVMNRPLRKTTITQDGVQFVKEVELGCGSSTSYCFDARARPTRARYYSQPSL